MRHEEAIELLKTMQNKMVDYAELVGAPAFAHRCKYVYPEPEDYAIEKAINAIKEVQQYREIGTIEECREAREKQIQEEPYYEGDGFDDKSELIYDTWICPNCGEKYEVDYDDYKYCPKCGQGILMEASND